MARDSFWEIVKSDIQRHTGCPEFKLWRTIKTVYYEEGLFFTILFRMAQRIHRFRNPVLRFCLSLTFTWTIYRFISVLLGIHIDSDAQIGKGFYIGHHGCIFVGPVRIGKYSNISQEVTIGIGRFGRKHCGIPTIGERVYIGPGAKIFGEISIGDNVSIGANAVVSKDIPKNAIVVGNPARIVGYQENNLHVTNVFDQSDEPAKGTEGLPQG